MQTLLDEWGDLDIIVNNVSVNGFQSIATTTLSSR